MKYRLRQCVWEITLGCCFACKYCGSGADGRKRENELTTGECLDVVRQLQELGCRRVSLIGGEVFLRDDWDIIVSALTSVNIKVCIITNGFHFNDKYIVKLKETGVESVAVSLDGPREIHDKYRQMGSYDRAVSAIDQLLESGIPVSVISTLNSENAEYLEEFLETVRKLGIFAWQLQACSPMGNAAKSGLSYQFDFSQVIEFVEKHMDEVPFVLGIAHNIGYHTESEGAIRGTKLLQDESEGTAADGFMGCTAGLSSIGIDSVGNVRGCESMYDDFFIEGNLRKKSLSEIWNDPESFAYNRKFHEGLLSGSCALCDKKNICAAGCRSYNYFVHGKLYESLYCARIRN